MSDTDRSVTTGLLLILRPSASRAAASDYDATVASERLPRETTPWPEYGGGDGQRFVDLQGSPGQRRQSRRSPGSTAPVMSPGNRTESIRSTTAFEVTPILADGRLVFCTPFNRVIALDPLTGGELWAFDPEVDLSGDYGNQLVCRGVAQWHDIRSGSWTRSAPHASSPTPTTAILIALDTATGSVCEDFGEQGRVDLNRGVGKQQWLGEYQLTSAPTVIGNRVVVGGAISDNVRIDAPSGVVRAFDARSGTQSWAFDLAPPDFDYSTGLVSDEGHALGTPNVWGTMVADEDARHHLPAHRQSITRLLPQRHAGHGLLRHRRGRTARQHGRGGVALQCGDQRFLGFRCRRGTHSAGSRYQRTPSARPSSSPPRWDFCSCWIGKPANLCCRSPIRRFHGKVH